LEFITFTYTIMTTLLIDNLEKVFKESASTEAAIAQSAYMRNLFPFFGIRKPVRQTLQLNVLRKYPICHEQELIDNLQLLWRRKEREFHYTALELAMRSQKLWTPRLFPIFEEMVRCWSWWDTVDEIAAKLLGSLVWSYPELISHFDDWIKDPLLWIRRSALLFQLKWKTQTDEERLFYYCKQTMHEKEFFIRKAIGWVLREYSKTHPKSVKNFINQHSTSLSSLSLKEGSKYLTG
jgi:3-methyladenine DNA glycosylase AlkD